jgi:hypothetical protein
VIARVAQVVKVDAGQAGGGEFAGVLATALGVRAALWILALIAAAGLTFLLTPMRHLRDLPRRAAVPTAEAAMTGTATRT